MAVVGIVGIGALGLFRTDGDDLIDGDFRGHLVDQLFAFLNAVHIGDVIGLLDFAILAFLPYHGFAGLQTRVDDGLGAVRHGFRTCLLVMRYALHAQNGLAIVFFDADAILLVQNDSFGIENGGRRQLAVGRYGTFTVGDDGHRAVLIDDQASGELVVNVIDVDGDLRRLHFVRLEESKQLIGAGRHRPERHFLAVDGDGGLIGAAYRHDGMVLQGAG